MKNLKKLNILVLLLMITISSSFVSCNSDNKKSESELAKEAYTVMNSKETEKVAEEKVTESPYFIIHLRGDEYQIDKSKWEEYKKTDTYNEWLTRCDEAIASNNFINVADGIEVCKKLINYKTTINPIPTMEVVSYIQFIGYLQSGGEFTFE